MNKLSIDTEDLHNLKAQYI